MSKATILSLRDGFFASACLMILWLPVFVKNFKKAIVIFYSPISFLNEMKGLFLSNYLESFKSELPFFFIILVISIFSGAFLFYLSIKNKQGKVFIFWLTINLFFYETIFFAILFNLFSNHIVLPAKNLIVASFFPIFSLGGFMSFLLTKKQALSKISGFLFLCFLIIATFISLKNTYFYTEQTYYGGPSYNDATDFIKEKVDLNSNRIAFIPSWQSYEFNYYFFNYDINKMEKVINYETCGTGLLQEKNNFVCWLVNPNINLQETSQIFIDCLKNNQPIYYKKAYLFKCQL